MKQRKEKQVRIFQQVGKRQKLMLFPKKLKEWNVNLLWLRKLTIIQEEKTKFDKYPKGKTKFDNCPKGKTKC